MSTTVLPSISIPRELPLIRQVNVVEFDNDQELEPEPEPDYAYYPPDPEQQPYAEDDVSYASEFLNPHDKKESDFQNMFCKKQSGEGYRCIYQKVKGSAKPSKLEYFVTKNISGHPICNALTGSIYSQYLVGSKMEYLFYKARMSTPSSQKAKQSVGYASNSKNNVTIAALTNKDDPDILFYDSPEEFETHQGITLTTEEKNDWRERYNRLLAFLAKMEQAKMEKQISQAHIYTSKIVVV